MQMSSDVHQAAPGDDVASPLTVDAPLANAPLAEGSARECPSCEGSGRVWDMLPRRPSRMQCPTCAGEGVFA